MDNSSTAPFVPSKSFIGAKAGFVFQMGLQGLGYYADKLYSPVKEKRRLENAVVNGVKRQKLAGEEDVEELNESSLKVLVAQLAKCHQKNEEQRIKHENNPEKFMDSEIKLHSLIKRASVVSAYPHLYPIFVSAGAPSLFVALIIHPNVDISLDAIEALADILDPSVIEEDFENTKGFFERFLKVEGLHGLANNLCRIDEALGGREQQGVETCLLIFEHMLEFDPEFVAPVCCTTTLLGWLLKKITTKGFDTNKLAASEILFMYLQASKQNRLAVIQCKTSQGKEINGVEMLLRGMHMYRKRQPVTEEEKECVENVFSAAVCMLLETENQKEFNELEGFELMVKVLRCRSYSYRKCWQVMDQALAYNGANCESFVQAGGLKVLFPAFMGRGKIAVLSKHGKLKAKTAIRPEDEEFVLSCIMTLSVYLQGLSYSRFMEKFVSHEFEKLDRLVELHADYLDKLENGASDGSLSKRLENGLYALQRVDCVLANLHAQTEYPVITKFILAKFHEQGLELGAVLETVKECLELLESEEVNSTVLQKTKKSALVWEAALQKQE
jgi:beta-catenin-like protein 1